MWRKMVVWILVCVAGCMAVCDTSQGAEALDGHGGATASAIPAFPGAEGFGARATGGRGGKVYLVETLEDYNPNEGEKPIPGSLRAAIDAEGPRIVVFRVAGMIDLKRNLNLDNDHITIAGQTAPGDGICLKTRPMYITASNVIVRYLRFRPGDEVGGAFDCVNGKRLSNLIMDHCSASWGSDECMTFVKNKNTTLQLCMVSESLRLSNHHKGAHGFGGVWGGSDTSFHHNLLAHHSSRNPRMADAGVVDYRNNVIYNWGYNTAYGGKGGEFNFVANYYKAGPATKPDRSARIVSPSESTVLYVDGNYVDGFPEITADNWAGGVQGKTSSTLETVRRRTPFSFAAVETHGAEEGYELVLKYVGANLPNRDAYDARVLEEVRTGTASFGKNWLGGGNGIIDSQKDVGGWPELKPGTAPADADRDDMPDAWEKKFGLNRDDASDNVGDKDGDGYTNIEEWLNATDPTQYVDYTNPANNAHSLHGEKASNLIVLQSNTYKHYIQLFNKSDSNKGPDHAAFPNSQAWDFLIDYCPFFDCPDKEIEKTYYYRWWLFRKHIKNQLGQFVISEFIKLPPICCPAGHHVYEGRWLRNHCVLDDYIAYWFTKLKQGGDPRRYSFWAADACYARFLVTGDEKWLVDILPDLVENYLGWVGSNHVGDDLFFQYDGKDGMEKSAGGHGLRPSINSYMYGDAKAISKIANLAGNKTLVDEYRIKAERIKAAVQKNLWDKKDEFFKTGHRKKDRLVPVPTREAIGFIPWYFNMPDSGYEVAWKQLMDPEGFLAPFGLTTAERRDPTFMTRKDNTPWDGQVWPFATTQTLVAMANLLNNPTQEIVSKEDYFQLLKLYTASHYSFFRNGTPMIGEWNHPVTGQWYIRSWSNERCSEHYNHSGFCDLIIAGLVGIRPQAGSDELVINPLLPENTWDYFCLDGVPYHGRVLTIIWDKTGKQYRKGTGLQVLCDGRRIGQRQQLGPIRLTLPTSIESSGE